MRKLSPFSTLMALMLSAFSVTLLVAGCATFGIGNQPPDQAALEAAAGLMVLEYLDLKDDDSLSEADVARALLKVGDETVQALGYTSFSALVESRLNEVTNGKFHPQVYMIYALTIKVLERLEEAKLHLVDPDAFAHVLE